MKECGINRKWIAVYEDGSLLEQCDKNGDDIHSYYDIDQVHKKIRQFVVLGMDNKPQLVVQVPKDWRLIYRARTFMHSDGTQNRIWIVGAQAKDKSGKQFISILYDDGRVVTTDRFREDIPELSPPELDAGRNEEWDFDSLSPSHHG